MMVIGWDKSAKIKGLPLKLMLFDLFLTPLAHELLALQK